MVRLSESINAMKPAWILGFQLFKVDLYPRLYPLFAFDTRIFISLNQVASLKRLVDFS